MTFGCIKDIQMDSIGKCIGLELHARPVLGTCWVLLARCAAASGTALPSFSYFLTCSPSHSRLAPCRDNRAPAAGRGVVFVGGPNSAAYARPQYGARRSGGPPGPGTIQAQIQENIARHGDRAPEGPPQVNLPTCSLHCSAVVVLAAFLAAFASLGQSRMHIHPEAGQGCKTVWHLKYLLPGCPCPTLCQNLSFTPKA